MDLLLQVKSLLPPNVQWINKKYKRNIGPAFVAADVKANTYVTFSTRTQDTSVSIRVVKLDDFSSKTFTSPFNYSLEHWFLKVGTKLHELLEADVVNISKLYHTTCIDCISNAVVFGSATLSSLGAISRPPTPPPEAIPRSVTPIMSSDDEDIVA